MKQHDTPDGWMCPEHGTDCISQHIVGLDSETEPEVRTVVTCEEIHFRPIGGGHGFVFDHDEFEAIVEHHEQR